MPLHLLISPPATGKTRTCLELVATAFQTQPLANVWILVPDQNQADELRARLAGMQSTLPAHVATFNDLYLEILELGDASLPVAGNVMLRRLLGEVTRALGAAGQLSHYGPICGLPGFLAEAGERIAELKRALVLPAALAEAARQQADPGLADLARIYQAYQARLQELGWADPEGLYWLADVALSAQPGLMADIRLLVVDGFEDFNPAQMRALQALTERAAETWVTLTGTPGMTRAVHRRFARALERLTRLQPAEVHTLALPPFLPPTLQAIEAGLWEPQAAPLEAGEDLARIEARSPAEEAREALRWLKAHIVRAGLALSACAMVVPELETYRAALRAAAAEFGLPLRFGRGPLLSSTPAAAAISDLLSLALADFPLRPLLDTVRSPYFDLSALGLERADAKRLEIASRYGQVVSGMQQWSEVLQLLAARTPPDEAPPEIDEEDAPAPRLAAGEGARRLLAGLTALAQRLAPPVDAIPLKAWALWLQTTLEDLKFFECAGGSGETHLSRAVEQALFALARSEALTGACPMAYPAFLKEWNALLAGFPVQEENTPEDPPAVRVLGLLPARGVRFEALAVVGLAEGAFPAIERADPLLGEAVRQQLGLELKLGQEQAGLFYQLVTRADRYLLLTRPYLAKDGEAWEPSPYWNALGELLADAPTRIRPDDPRALAEAASANEYLFWAARRSVQSGLSLPAEFQARFALRWKHIGETQAVLNSRLGGGQGEAYNGGLAVLAAGLLQRYGEHAGWSASRLEAYATCPFSFLVSSALGLEVLEAPQIGYQASQLGSLLHGVLEQVYHEVADAADLTEILTQLPLTAGRVFASAPQDYQFRPSLLWEVQQSELLTVLEAAVQGLAALDPTANWRPLVFEAKFGLEGQPPVRIDTPEGAVLLHGIVDRIDINPAGELRVIDYKSGSAHLAAQDLIDGRRLQLPIYALAASQALGLGETVEGFYWKLFQGEASSLKLSGFKSEEGKGPQTAFDVAASHIANIVAGIRQGAFEPHAPAGGCPSYCAAASWCWQYLSARY